LQRTSHPPPATKLRPRQLLREVRETRRKKPAAEAERRKKKRNKKGRRSEKKKERTKKKTQKKHKYKKNKKEKIARPEVPTAAMKVGRRRGASVLM